MLFFGEAWTVPGIGDNNPFRKQFNAKWHIMLLTIIVLIVIGSSIWVYTDAKNIGVKKGQLKGVCDLGAEG